MATTTTPQRAGTSGRFFRWQIGIRGIGARARRRRRDRRRRREHARDARGGDEHGRNHRKTFTPPFASAPDRALVVTDDGPAMESALARWCVDVAGASRVVVSRPRRGEDGEWSAETVAETTRDEARRRPGPRTCACFASGGSWRTRCARSPRRRDARRATDPRSSRGRGSSGRG